MYINPCLNRSRVLCHLRSFSINNWLLIVFWHFFALSPFFYIDDWQAALAHEGLGLVVVNHLYEAVSGYAPFPSRFAVVDCLPVHFNCCESELDRKKRKVNTTRGLPYVCVSYHNLFLFVLFIFRRKFRIAIYSYRKSRNSFANFLSFAQHWTLESSHHETNLKIL